MHYDFEEMQVLNEMRARPLHCCGIWNLLFVLTSMTRKESVRPINRSLQDAVLIQLDDEKQGGLLIQTKCGNAKQELIAGVLHTKLKDKV